MQTKNLKQWLPFIVWVMLVFAVSSIPRLSGDEFGMPRWSDKIAHFLEYLILAFLLYRGVRGERPSMGVTVWLVVIATGLVIASIDEFHQSFIPGRDANIVDWIADVAGVAAGALIGVRRRREPVKRLEEA